MLPTDRIVYSAISERPPLKLPDRARMACGRMVRDRVPPFGARGPVRARDRESPRRGI